MDRVCRGLAAIGLVTSWLATEVATSTALAAGREDALRAQRQAGVPFAGASRTAGTDTILTCFEGPLSEILNPGCFFLPNPPTGGDCVSKDEQYFIQYLTPSFGSPQRITGFGFISNDGATVFPRAGVVLIPTAENRFPTPAELAALQVQNVPTPHDTAVVVVDLRHIDPPLVVTSGMDIVICLQFPESTTPTDAIGEGAGIAVDATAPDQNCDFFTLDGGATYARNDFGNDPLDWGFELGLEPSSPVQATSWTDVKRLYGGERARLHLYREP
jgi:hypothetical protein